MYFNRILFLLMTLLFFIVFFPQVSLAADFRFQRNSINIPSGEVINDDLYIVSGQVKVEGIIKGDLIVMAGQVQVNGSVMGSLFIAGGQVMVEGEVANNLRMVGGTVVLKGKIGHDLLVAGGNIEINEGAEVKHDVKVASGELVIAGKAGSIQAAVGTLTLKSTAQVNGDIIYRSENEVNIESGAKISGVITRKSLPVQKKGLAALFAFNRILSILMTVLLSLLFLFVFPHKTEKVALSWQKQFGLNLLWGFLFLIAIPFATILLFITVLGFPLGIGVILIYIILLYLGKIAGIISFGSFLQNVGKKEKEPKPEWLFVIISVIIYNLLGLVPFIGWLAAFLIFLAGLGSLIRFDWNIIIKLKEDKSI